MLNRVFNLKILVLLGIILLAALLVSGCAEKTELPEDKTAHVETESEQPTENVGDETSHAGEGAKAYWSYSGEEGPEHWSELGYPDCSGSEQSPVDIPSNTTLQGGDITFNYAPTALNIVNNGHTIEVDYDAGSTMEVENKTYELLQFHFHAPSEHTINNTYYDMELHLVHQSADGEYVVIGVMLEPGSENDAYAPIWEHLPAGAGEVETISGVSISAFDLLPENKSYYRYNGSFTTPPCTQGVKWFVLSTPVELSSEQTDTFTAIYSGNNRPIQPLNERGFITE